MPSGSAIIAIWPAGIVGLVIGGVFYRAYYEPRHRVSTAVVDLLRDPATRDHLLYGAGPTPAARGRFLWNESGEGHVFVSDLPAAPEGKIYAVWTIAKSSAPRFVGAVKTDTLGQGSLHINSPRSDQPMETFAVTLEPAGTTAAPTGPILLASSKYVPLDSCIRVIRNALPIRGRLRLFSLTTASPAVRIGCM